MKWTNEKIKKEFRVESDEDVAWIKNEAKRLNMSLDEYYGFIEPGC